jgi:hypothetical protein
MEKFAAGQDGRVVEVLEVSEKMVAHGVALDRVRSQRDDGPYFATIDPDIKANAPFVAPLVRHLRGSCAAATSGTEVWSDDNLVPPGHIGVAGEHFVSQDGFVFGSPHYAIYRRDAMDATCARWGIGMGSGGPDLSEEATARLASMGHEYLVYDTGKLVNTFLQADGHTVVHEDFDHLVHIGGLSHFLAPTGWATDDAGGQVPNWKTWGGHPSRYDVAEFTALTLRSLVDGKPAPEVPDTADPDLAKRLHHVLDEVGDLVARYG